MLTGAVTHPGMVRNMNQDYYTAKSAPGHGIYIVADGMGGHNGGEVASRTSVVYAGAYIEDEWNEEAYINDRIKLIRDALNAANREVYSLSVNNSRLRGMGTTLSMAVIEGETLYTGHIGDSRIYLVRDGQICKLTDDHSLVAELIRNGSITPEEGDSHPQKNIITRALGTDRDIEADVSKREIMDGDTLLLCTDGLTNMLRCEDILEICMSIDDPQLLCERLVEEANNRGGKDNITVIAVKVRWDK